MKSSPTPLYISVQPQSFYKENGLESDIDRMKRYFEGRIEVIDGIHESLPKHPQNSHIIVGGSIHYVSENLPWMEALGNWVKERAQERRAILGICFGKQFLSKAFGAQVKKMEKPVRGESGIILTEAGEGDPLFKDIPLNFLQPANHEEGVCLPENCQAQFKILATDIRGVIQAIAIGDNIRGVQFHPEATPADMERILRNGRPPVDEPREKRENPLGRKILRNFVTHF